MTEEIKAYECGCCGNLWETEQDEEDCCNPHAKEVTAYKCDECGEIYYNKEDAEYCCPIANMNAEKG